MATMSPSCGTVASPGQLLCSVAPLANMAPCKSLRINLGSGLNCFLSRGCWLGPMLSPNKSKSSHMTTELEPGMAWQSLREDCDKASSKAFAVLGSGSRVTYVRTVWFATDCQYSGVLWLCADGGALRDSTSMLASTSEASSTFAAPSMPCKALRSATSFAIWFLMASQGSLMFS